MHVTRLTDEPAIIVTRDPRGITPTLAWPAAAAVIGSLSFGAWIVVARLIRFLLLQL